MKDKAKIVKGDVAAAFGLRDRLAATMKMLCADVSTAGLKPQSCCPRATGRV